jgi:two-component system sensor histidine kinase and response regulator WspE
VREVERKLLSDSGYAVTTAEDGLDAWNTVKDEKFDLIITDIDMPNMDGIEFLLQVREDHDLHDIPVIIVSYKDRKEDRLKGLNAGADYYLTKGSFQDQTLLDAIFDLVGSPTDD